MEGEHLQSPHDRLFKQTFGRVESAAAFFQGYLPAELAAAIDWETLTPAPGSFVDETLRHQESDLLFSARLRGRMLQIYCLFEHQSTVNRQMPFRLLKYKLRDARTSTGKRGKRSTAKKRYEHCRRID